MNGTPIDISIVAKQTTTGGGTRSYMVLRDKALANPRGYIEGQAPTDIVYQNVFNAEVPLTGSFGAGNNLNLAQDLEGQDIASFAFGDTLSATSENQFVIGYNNTPDSTKTFIIANSGNIFTVDYEGNVSAGDLDVGAISATSVTINGEPVEYLMDDKLEATSAWVSGNYETTTNATNNYNTLNAKINNLSATDDGKFEATSGWANSTFETKNDAADKYNTLTGQTDYLSGQVSSNTTAIGELNNAVGSKANQTDLEALSGQVEAITVPTKVSELENDVPYLSSIPTSYVQKNEIAEMATTGWVDENYAKKGDIPTDVYTKTEVNAISTALSSAVSGAGYLTSVPDTVSATAVNTATGWVNEQGYQNAAQVSAIASAYAGGGSGDVTSAQVSAIVESYGYATTSQIPTGTAQLTNTANYLSSVVVGFTDSTNYVYSAPASSIIFGQDFSMSNFGTDTLTSVTIDWNGFTVSDRTWDNPNIKKIYFDNSFNVEADWDEGSASISLARPIPLSTSQLTNDSGYTTSANVSAIVESYNYATTSQLPTDYTTSAQVSSIVEGYGYQNAAQVSAIASGYAGGEVPTKVSELINDVGYITLASVPTDYTTSAQVSAIASAYAQQADGMTNKQILSTLNSNQITYDSTVEIFKTTYTGSTLTLNTVTVPANSLSAGEVATFEEWISLNNDIPSADFSAGSNTLVGEIPSALLSSKTNVFVRRLVNNNGTITQYVSFAYEF